MEFIKNTIRECLNEQISYELDGDYVNYYINGDKIGYIEYYYDGGTFSEYLPNPDKHKEFHIAMLELYDDFKGNNYSTQMLNHIKKFAKGKGATIITLKVDYGVGFAERQPDRGLEKLYLKNGFKYQHSEEEYNLNKDLNLGSMYFLL